MHSNTSLILILMLFVSFCCSSLAKKSSSTPTILNNSLLAHEGQVYKYSVTRYVKWFCFNTSVYDCCLIKYITCLENGPALPFGRCATYNENNSTKTLSFAKCPYLQPNNYNVTAGHISLPVILTELNDYMCGPLNRKGLVCSECAEGFGPSVTSYGYKCANCTNAMYNIPLFLFVQFVPITFVYIIILVFRISVTSPPMPCFIMYAQIFGLTFQWALNSLASRDSYSRELFFTTEGDVRLDMKILGTFYGLFSHLDVFQYVLPPLCLSSKLRQIHVVLLGYISVFYPIFLIVLTWVCVHFHDNNFRPLVWLWRPFHKCFVRLRREWDIKSDLVDVFITFFILSFAKSSYQMDVLLEFTDIKTYDQSGNIFVTHRLSVDQTVDYLGSTHLPFAVTALLLFFVFNILPPLLLILYPFGIFRSCLSKCRLDFIAVNIFTEKIHRYYRNGLDGGRDMRSFSGLYFYFMIGVYLLVTFILHLVFHYHQIHHHSIFSPTGVTAIIIALTVAITKPYKKMYMNHLDTLLLSCVALQNFTSATKLFHITRVIFFIPIFAFFLMILVKTIKHVTRYPCNIKAKLQEYTIVTRLRQYLATKRHVCTHTDYCVTESPRAAQPLIQPTSSEISYGTA